MFDSTGRVLTFTAQDSCCFGARDPKGRAETESSW
jgi:hypothetical protein